MPEELDLQPCREAWQRVKSADPENAVSLTIAAWMEEARRATTERQRKAALAAAASWRKRL